MQIHVIAFEGPDPYAQAGGIATRITGLTRTMADAGFNTHLWFVGDPALPGHELRAGLELHRWCQWLSREYHRGVYDGEHAKCADFAASLPPYLLEHTLRPHLARAERAVILAEEWQTVDAVLHLDWLLRRAGLRERVDILWNANNTFGFGQIDWRRLASAAVITTVSRYMKLSMQQLGVEPLVIPNGLSADAFVEPPEQAVAEFRHRLRGREVLLKVARWDPDKRWLLAVDIVRELKRRGSRPLLIARGGVEPHGVEVLSRAAARGLRVTERKSAGLDVHGILAALDGVDDIDVVSLRSPIDPESRRVLFREASVVLANSGHEPFGLVGLETMAAGGLACTGSTGEDYAVAGRNALVTESEDPREFVGLFERLRAHPGEEQALRREGMRTALDYAWPQVLRRVFLPRLQLLAAGVRLAGGSKLPARG